MEVSSNLYLAVYGTFLSLLLGYGSLGCMEEEKVGLLQLKASINHPNGTALSSWGAEVGDCCRWRYVTCDNKTSRVIRLSLSSIRDSELGEWSLNASLLLPFQQLQILDMAENGLTGLCKLNLEALDLSRNGFEGSLPACLNNLTSLRLLDLSENDFSGTIPSSLFSNLKSLEYISLSDNHFEGSIHFGSLFNHSRLVVFDLASNNKYLKVETENPIWSFPLFQLKILRLSNCTLNWPSWVLPSFLPSQYDLRMVDLSHNNITGDIPTWLLDNNTKLEYLSFGSNSLTGVLDLPSNSKHSHMLLLDFSSNCIHGELPPFIGSIFPGLEVLNLSRNALQGNIPSSMGDMEQLVSLDLSNNNLSGQLPEHMMMGCISLLVLKLSNNSLHGTLPTKSNLTDLFFLSLDNNNFSGEISRGFLNSSSLQALDISSNSLWGQIPNWIGDFSVLSTLSLSRNHLDGVVPTSLCKLNELRFLDLSHNKIGPTLPPCANLKKMKFLHLENNELSGPIPHVLSEATSLVTLNLRDNKLSGPIPHWISLLSKLRVLLLKGNELEDSIPLQLCQLKSVSILDLSHNHLSGTIPSCLDNITFGRKAPLMDGTFFTSAFGGTHVFPDPSSYKNQFAKVQFIHISFGISAESEEIEFITKSWSESYMGNILYLMSGLDLSGNKLTGPIPPEIGNLSGIHSLNLSYNQLIGTIPETFSNLQEIESLDLSHNRLTSQIPPQMVELNFLTVFTVAHNNLSGKTPERKFQFATFEQSSYEGNPLLCGLPLERCSTPTSAPPALKPPVSNNRENSSWEAIFLWSFGGSYGVTFLGIIAFLYLNSYYRELLFYFIGKHVPFL
ncbi:receptor-like protein 13 isoform X2 [Vitis vinifera]|uniref:receptor-like protein 13 isoform X2 n=1 Tax=Vitis vinifera TaxID=29760 RepID=UPI0005401A4A|nr:receptor-like protein 13 isoform X2 [Vitis vinifera]|eukprot:XP_010656508.1 PREDICTED: leucine-rich repeat receptor protein kinase EMS1 isoform X2 [Vitis vinifera]